MVTRIYNSGLGTLPQWSPGAKSLVMGSRAKPPETERIFYNEWLSLWVCDENSTYILFFHYFMINVKDIKSLPVTLA